MNYIGNENVTNYKNSEISLIKWDKCRKNGIFIILSTVNLQLMKTKSMKWNALYSEIELSTA